MKISQAIDRTFEIRPDSFSTETKVGWLNDLDHKLFLEVILTHEPEIIPENTSPYYVYGNEIVHYPVSEPVHPEFVPYDPSDLERELLVQPPYDKLYISYLRSKIEEAYGEIDAYNNAAHVFNGELLEFKRFYNKYHRPI